MKGQILGVGFLGLLLLGAGCATTAPAPEPEQVAPVEVVMDEGTPVQINEALDGAFVLDVAESTVLWGGQKLVGAQHEGTLAVSGGEAILVEGQVAMGSVRLDMTSITDTDLQDEEMRATLETHLKSPDFFSAELYPEATLEMMELAWEGGDEYVLTGVLTIKGIAQEIAVPVTVLANPAGYRVMGMVILDRTLWDIRFGSNKFFENLGDAAIQDTFDVSLDLFFTPTDIIPVLDAEVIVE